MTVGETHSSYCYFHPDVPSVKPCSVCHKELCASCLKTIDGVPYCPHCFEQKELAPVRQTWMDVARAVVVALLVFVIIVVAAIAVLFGLLFMVCGRR